MFAEYQNPREVLDRTVFDFCPTLHNRLISTNHSYRFIFLLAFLFLCQSDSVWKFRDLKNVTVETYVFANFIKYSWSWTRWKNAGVSRLTATEINEWRCMTNHLAKSQLKRHVSMRLGRKTPSMMNDQYLL